jgi:hypothetical protein
MNILLDVLLAIWYIFLGVTIVLAIIFLGWTIIIKFIEFWVDKEGDDYKRK